MIERSAYIKKLINSMRNNNVKVITGIRRCGKSTLLFSLFKKYLLNSGIEESNIVEIRFDDSKFFELRNPFLLTKYLNEEIKKRNNLKMYVFLDEIQYVENRKDKESEVSLNVFDVLNGLRNNPNVDVYVTGSNSKMLSKDIITEFRGRSTQIRVHPLSFKEFYSSRTDDLNSSLREYLILGGMPGLLSLNKEEKQEYLINLYKETYIKDIVERNKIERPDLLNNILDFLASTVSSLTNTNKIANSLTSIKNEKVSHLTVFNYTNYLVDSFLVSEARRYDIKGKMYFEYPSKFYFEDLGLRNARLNFRQMDEGHLMENLIYNELISRGLNVDIGLIYKRTSSKKIDYEIDFVVNKIDKRIYIQSAYKIDNVEKETIEKRSLKMIPDNFKKIVIRNDLLMSYYDDDGIYHMTLTDFLLKEELLF